MGMRNNNCVWSGLSARGLLPKWAREHLDPGDRQLLSIPELREWTLYESLTY